MKRSFCFLLVLLSISIFIQSCEENSTTPTNNDEIIPLKIGNYWKYANTYYNQQSTIGFTDTTTSYVVRDSIWNGEKIYWLGASPTDFSRDSVCYLNRSDGYYFINLLKKKGIDSMPQLLFKYPAKVNDFFLRVIDTMFVSKKNLLYTVPAGSFICYEYRFEATFYRSDTSSYEFKDVKFLHYLAPGIGLIANEYYEIYPDGKTYLSGKDVLIDYKVK